MILNFILAVGMLLGIPTAEHAIIDDDVIIIHLSDDRVLWRTPAYIIA